tara:strand:+ start:1442 stop:2008 length:567 start_codon:yes stop_codon:yes gene_type:complete
MKTLIKILCLSSFLFSQLYSNELHFSDPKFYISPGLHIGINSNMEFFYGFQISLGSFWLYSDYTLPQDVDYPPNYFELLLSMIKSNFISTSLSFGYKKIPKNNNYSFYSDFQVSHVHYEKNSFVMLGFGLIDYNDGLYGMKSKLSVSTLRLTPIILYDYEFKNKNHNISLIGFLPIYLLAPLLNSEED